MEPEHAYEFDGYYKGVVFPTVNIILDNTYMCIVVVQTHSVV